MATKQRPLSQPSAPQCLPRAPLWMSHRCQLPVVLHSMTLVPLFLTMLQLQCLSVGLLVTVVFDLDISGHSRSNPLDLVNMKKAGRQGKPCLCPILLLVVYTDSFWESGFFSLPERTVHNDYCILSWFFLPFANTLWLAIVNSMSLYCVEWH